MIPATRSGAPGHRSASGPGAGWRRRSRPRRPPSRRARPSPAPGPGPAADLREGVESREGPRARGWHRVRLPCCWRRSSSGKTSCARRAGTSTRPWSWPRGTAPPASSRATSTTARGPQPGRRRVGAAAAAGGSPRSRRSSSAAAGKWRSSRGWGARAAVTSRSDTTATSRGTSSGVLRAARPGVQRRCTTGSGEYPRDEITVLLYARVAFRDVTRMPGLGRRGLRRQDPDPGRRAHDHAGDVALRDIIVHEMAHAFLYRMAPEGLPRWFNEGLATSFQGWDPAAIRAWFAEHPPEGHRDPRRRRPRARRPRRRERRLRGRPARAAEIEELRGFRAVRESSPGSGRGARSRRSSATRCASSSPSSRTAGRGCAEPSPVARTPGDGETAGGIRGGWIRPCTRAGTSS